MTSAQSLIIDRARLPERFPTHAQTDAFWAALGRAVASFGFLEWTLRRAIFALTGDRPAPPDEEELRRAMADWNQQLEVVATSTLVSLANAFGRAAKDHQRADMDYVSALVVDIKSAAEVRNALCHASWEQIDPDRAAPLYIAKTAGGEQGPSRFLTEVDVPWLEQAQRHAAALACATMDAVTTLGLPFPGSSMKKGPPQRGAA